MQRKFAREIGIVNISMCLLVIYLWMIPYFQFWSFLTDVWQFWNKIPTRNECVIVHILAYIFLEWHVTFTIIYFPSILWLYKFWSFKVGNCWKIFLEHKWINVKWGQSRPTSKCGKTPTTILRSHICITWKAYTLHLLTTVVHSR